MRVRRFATGPCREDQRQGPSLGNFDKGRAECQAQVNLTSENGVEDWCWVGAASFQQRNSCVSDFKIHMQEQTPSARALLGLHRFARSALRTCFDPDNGTCIFPKSRRQSALHRSSALWCKPRPIVREIQEDYGGDFLPQAANG